jgi:cytochrome c5
LFSFEGCKKDSTVNSDFLYFPTITDVTPNATLQELQDGRDLYISYCNRCHGLYLPESKTPAQWKNVMSSMGPKTGLSAADQLLITKYLCKGRQ